MSDATVLRRIMKLSEHELLDEVMSSPELLTDSYYRAFERALRNRYAELRPQRVDRTEAPPSTPSPAPYRYVCPWCGGPSQREPETIPRPAYSCHPDDHKLSPDEPDFVPPTSSQRRRRGLHNDHVKIGGTAWRAAIWLRGQWSDSDTWTTTSDLAAEIDADPKTLPTRLAPLLAAGVVERRWITRADRRGGREAEWRWKA